MAENRAEVERLRAVFFAKTRRTVAVLYSALGAVALVLAVVGAVVDPQRAGIALAVGFGLTVLMFKVSALIPVPASAMNAIVGASVVVGVVVVSVVDLNRLNDATLAGAASGVCAGAILGIAAIRRRLADDDELILRQKRLGWDP